MICSRIGLVFLACALLLPACSLFQSSQTRREREYERYVEKSSRQRQQRITHSKVPQGTVEPNGSMPALQTDASVAPAAAAPPRRKVGMAAYHQQRSKTAAGRPFDDPLQG